MQLIIRKFFILLTILLFPLALLSMQKEQVIVNTYKISPNIENFDCHGSCIIEVSPGILCVAWNGGPGPGKSNIDMKQNVGIWLSHFKNGCWTDPKEIVHSPHSVCWTPVLTKNSKGELILFYRMGNDPRHTISMFKTSDDGGINWSKEEILPAGIIGPTRSKPLLDSEGNMICGSSTEVGNPEDMLKATACWIEILSDGKWSKYGPIEISGKKFGCIEPVLFWTKNEHLKMLCRDRSNRIGSQGWIWIAESIDKGKRWSKLQKTDLPNPDSGFEILSLINDSFLLIYNHSHTNRYPLSIALSNNSGHSWEPLFNLEDDSGEFPSATLDSQGNIHVSYAWTPPGKNQRQIKHVVLDTHKLMVQKQAEMDNK
jgi:predicted neuraminidase